MKILPDGTVTIGSVPAGTKIVDWCVFNNRIILATDQGVLVSDNGELKPLVVRGEPADMPPVVIKGQIWWNRQA